MFSFRGKYGQVFLFSVVVFAICAATMADENNARQIVAQTTGAFADRFLKAAADGSPGSLIASPLSAQMVLAMAAYGANGTTASQMRSSLQIPDDNRLGQSGYRSLIDALSDVDGVELRLANKIYTATGFSIKPTYKQLTASKFASSTEKVDFSNATAAANTINSWCESQTNNRIKDVVRPDTLGPETRLILVNAVYFKGQWAEQFSPLRTQNRSFHVDTRTAVNVPTMHITERFRFWELPELDAKCIEIPYKGEEISMIVILPNEVDGLKRVQDNLQQENLDSKRDRAWSRIVNLFLPKFKTETELNLKNTLQKLGMGIMFEDEADFSGISDTPLRVDKAIQKAFIEVNEEGTEAAAVTGLQIVATSAIVSEPVVFDVNRPFYYQIRYTNQRLSVPLFTGVWSGQQ